MMIFKGIGWSVAENLTIAEDGDGKLDLERELDLFECFVMVGSQNEFSCFRSLTSDEPAQICYLRRSLSLSLSLSLSKLNELTTVDMRERVVSTEL